MNSIDVIPKNESQKWDKIISSFSNFDVYYLQDYLKAFQIHGDGDPLLYYYKSDNISAMCVVMKRDVAKLPFCTNLISYNTYYDITTPYGYGGWLFEGEVSISELQFFSKVYLDFLINENIIAEFVRYHPLLRNADYMRHILPVIDLGTTISMELTHPEIMWKNISSKNRNMIRKAQKNGVTIYHERNISIFTEFIQMYNTTMEHDNAEAYYFFSKEFYNSIHYDLFNNYEMFYAVYNDKIIAMSIIIYANDKMHYHLSGSYSEYRHLAPSNLLLYEAACWGASKGLKLFHLGGGLGSAEDNLYKFKRAFSNSKNQFSIGKRVINNEIYNRIVQMRHEQEPDFNINSSFFPLYRTN